MRPVGIDDVCHRARHFDSASRNLTT